MLGAPLHIVGIRKDMRRPPLVVVGFVAALCLDLANKGRLKGQPAGDNHEVAVRTLVVRKRVEDGDGVGAVERVDLFLGVAVVGLLGDFDVGRVHGLSDGMGAIIATGNPPADKGTPLVAAVLDRENLVVLVEKNDRDGVEGLGVGVFGIGFGGNLDERVEALNLGDSGVVSKNKGNAVHSCCECDDYL